MGRVGGRSSGLWMCVCKGGILATGQSPRSCSKRARRPRPRAPCRAEPECTCALGGVECGVDRRSGVRLGEWVLGERERVWGWVAGRWATGQNPACYSTRAKRSRPHAPAGESPNVHARNGLSRLSARPQPVLLFLARSWWLNSSVKQSAHVHAMCPDLSYRDLFPFGIGLPQRWQGG